MKEITVSFTPPPAESLVCLGPTQTLHSRSLVLEWMQRNRWQYMDQCNECNTTKMAEDASEEYDLYKADRSSIPEWVFELSGQVGDNS